MKKLIIVILLLFSTIPIVNINAEIIEASYDLTYTHGYWYDLYDGTFEANPNFSVTNRNKILYGSLILDSIDSFHHLIYFDKNLKMIGYMNTALTDIETDLFIDNIASFTPDIPSNAVYFALMGFYPYLNNTPIPEINNLTLGQVFGGSYDVGNTYNVLSSTSFLDIDIAELNNHTLREVFEGGNEILNHNFDTNTVWASMNGSLNISGGVAKVTGNGTDAITNLRQLVSKNITSDNKMYVRARVRTLNTLTTQIRLRLIRTDLGNIYGADTVINNPIQNVWYDISQVISEASSFTNYYAYVQAVYANSTNQNGNETETDYFYSINLTSLGISSLTVSQMDYWFSVYQSIKTGTTQFATGYANSGTGYVFYSNTTTNVLLNVNVFSNNFLDDGYYSPIYQNLFDQLSPTQQTNQLTTWTNNMWQLLDFVDLNWFPTQTALTNYYTLFQNNIIFDDYYFDDIELLVSQPTVSYEYNLDEDNRGIVDFLNDLMDDIGLGSSMAKFSISLIVIVIVMVILWLIKVPSLIVVMGGLLMLILFIVLGWIPIYIIVIVSAVLFYLIATNQGGSQDA